MNGRHFDIVSCIAASGWLPRFTGQRSGPVPGPFRFSGDGLTWGGGVMADERLLNGVWRYWDQSRVEAAYQRILNA